MRSKYIFIILLISLLTFTVVKMMQFESSLREEKKVRMYIEDNTKPLISKYSDDDLRRMALQADYYFTANGNYFKGLRTRFLEDNRLQVWDDLFLQGVNLGVAVPGKFPAEFSLTFDGYLEWIRMIGEMNANVIRVYTILPPVFYEALAYYNLHYFDKPVYLMQGVWVEVPVSEDYYDQAFVRDFEKEIIDVIDVIHGHAVLREYPGKAAGVYSTDVSKYVVALLLGREWEPASVFKTNQVNKNSRYNGDFISMNQGNAMEAWLARMMDFTVLYETQTYRFQHPVSFVNWLPLDPMYHSTEIIENNRVREYDNDLESVDFARFHASELFYPGIYAAYHVYPYYPDFIYLQESYKNAGHKESQSDMYFQYLKDLKQHTQGMPLVIAEYGLPSSRGNSHVSPDGFHQGGHSEADQAILSLSLTKDIVNSFCAGAIYFEWIDEWFKHNWLVMDFEQPADDRVLWHNMENPEQNFGILALEDKSRMIDGELNDWDINGFDHDQIGLACDADATYFNLAASVPGFDFKNHNLYIAIDTYDKEKGDHKLPFLNRTFDNGFEFLVELKSPDSAFILVDEPYSVYTDIYNDYVPVYASRNNSNGKFIHQLMLTNRSRVSLTGEKTDSVVVDRSPLIFGNSSDPAFSNADWYFNEDDGYLEMRLDWHLLNVSDPAKRFVLDDREGTSEIEYIKTDAFHIYVFVTDKNGGLTAQYPENDPYSFTWEEWLIPEYTQRLKPIYYTLRDYFKNPGIPEQEKTDREKITESFKITDFFDNKKGAISMSFDHASYSQYQYGLPVLKKYGLSATFGMSPELLDVSPRTYLLEGDAAVKRMGIEEAREIAVDHDLAYEPVSGATTNEDGFYKLREKTGAKIFTMHCNEPVCNKPVPRSVIFVRKGATGGVLQTSYNNVPYSVAYPGFSQSALDSIIQANRNRWLIMNYHHLYANQAEIPQQISQEMAKRLFTHKSDFEKQVRLMRNSDYWISSETAVFKYIREKKESAIQIEQFKNMIFLNVINGLDQAVYDQPLTIEYKSNARIIRLEGTETDGTYMNKNGSFYFNVVPNKEFAIEIVE